jgi:hypothetical protein
MATLDDLKTVLDSIDVNLSNQGRTLNSLLSSQQSLLLSQQRSEALAQASRTSSRGSSGGGAGRNSQGNFGTSGVGNAFSSGLAGLGLGLAAGGGGIAALGLAMPAFFGGLLAGDAGLGWLSQFGSGFNFDNLKAAAIGFTDMISSIDQNSLVALAAIMGISVVGGTRGAIGLGSMGFGISAFLGGLLAGDAVFSSVSALGGNLDFNGMKSAMLGFSTMITSIDPRSLEILAGIMGLSALTGLIGRSPTGAGTALGSMGFGISAFLGGLLAGDAVFASVSALGGNLDFNSLKSALSGFSSVIDSLSPAAATALAGIIGASGVAALASRGTGIQAAVGTAAIMTGLGAGITGLMVGLVGGGALIDMINDISGVTGEGLSTAFSSFSASIGNLSPAAAAALASIIGTSGVAALASRGTGIRAALGTAAIMTGIGAGISGLMLGLTAGGAGIAWINDISGASGDGMVSAFRMFNDSIGELNNENAITALTAIVGAGGGIGAIVGAINPGMAAGAGLGIFAIMTGIGAGIAGLMTGLAVGDVAISAIQRLSTGGGLVNMFRAFNDSILSITPEGIERLTEISNLNLGNGLRDLVDGVTSFFSIDVREGIGERIRNFFTGIFGGTVERESIISQLLREFEPLSGAEGQNLTAGINNFASALVPLTNALSALGDLDARTINFQRMAQNLRTAVPIIEGAIIGESGGLFGTRIRGLASPEVDYETAVRNIVMLRQALAGIIDESVIDGMSAIREAGAGGGVSGSPVIINAPDNSVNTSAPTTVGGSTTVITTGGSRMDIDYLSIPGGVQ